MSADWPPLTYGAWSATCDTLHAHTQVLGKLAVQLAPPEPQLQHAALRLTARGWETFPLPAPDGSGAIVAALDLRTHEAVVAHTGGHEIRIALTPDRPVAEVTRELLEGVGRLGGAVDINPAPQEVPWTVPLDEDDQHATYDADQVATYFAAATQPAPDGFGYTDLSPAAGRWDAKLGEYVLDWDDIRESPDPHIAAVGFGRAAFRHGCAVCEWDPALAATAQGVPPPIR